MSTPVTYRNGIGNQAAYAVSGIPFMTGATLSATDEDAISFPFVTKAVTVINTGAAAMRVHYNASSSGNVVGGFHFITLEPAGATLPLSRFTFNAKCKEIFVSSTAGTTYEVFAELTTVSTDQMYILTGSGLTV